MTRQTRKRDKKLLGNFALLLAFVLAAAGTVHSASLITNLGLEKKGDFTYFTIFAQNKITFTHFILPAKDDKPHRIVVDLEDAIHKLPRNNFRNLPLGIVEAVRTSQYQAEPKKITRVVLDLKEPVIYKVVEQGGENQVTFSLSTKKDPPSASWAAVPEALKTKTEPPKGINVKKKDKKELAGQEPVSPVETKPSKAQKKSEAAKGKPALAEKAKDIPVSGEKPQIKQTEPAPAPAEVKKREDEKTVSKGVEVETEKGVPKAEEAMHLPAIEKAQAPEMPSPEPVYLPAADSSVLQEPPWPVSKEEEDGAAQRESLVYLDEGRRDPFIPVTEEIDFSFGEIPLPSVENLRLVGTMEDQEGYKALLEDDVGYGYLLKSGDKVKNGFVVNVFNNKIFFQIEEYGWSRVISLELAAEY